MTRFHVRDRMIAAARRATRPRQHADGTRVELRSATRPEFVLHIQVTADRLDGGFVAEVVEFPGCMSQGETVHEAVENAVHALGEVLTASADIALQQQDTEHVDGPGDSFKVAVPVL